MITAEDSVPLKGRRVVIAGGTSGIGRATAVRLVREGARVLVFGRDETKLQEALDDIRAEAADGGEVFGIAGDNGSHEDVARAFAEADARLGGVDIVVGVAGVGAESAVDTEPSEIEYAVRANVTGYMFDTYEAMKRMKPAEGQKSTGQFVFIGSMSAVSRGEGNDIYVATKAANQGYVESLRKSLNKTGIRVSLIEPGLIGTDLQNDKTPPDEQRKMEEAGEMLKAEDIAAAVLYILSQPARSQVWDLRIDPTGQEE